MAVLFFDGFDRYTLLKDLNPDYWSFEPQSPVEYKKYAFGGYTYNHSIADYGYGDNKYTYYSPNNGTLPTGVYVGHAVDGYYGINVSGNPFPGFGSPPGFLALTNLDISDNNLLAPITYIQLSGFQLPSGQTSFLTTRFLGLETKDTNYASSDKPGRFGAKHPLIAFCSGNITGLIINVVKVTGNHLSIIENQKMTMGLEIEQPNGGISGIFDLNISEDLINYKIKSVYDNAIANYRLADVSGRILTIDTDTTSNWSSPISRWCHFQFGIINTGIDHYIQIKLEDIDLLSIPSDDGITDKDLWEDKIYISGFNYDNIRFFNRTYNGSFIFNDLLYVFYQPYYDNIRLVSRYYMKGAVTLIDDIILSDNSGSTTTFLGKNAKVVPFSPGIGGNLDNNGAAVDGLTQWDKNIGSYRTVFKNADGDDGKISTATSGFVTAVPYRPMLTQYGFQDNGSVNVWGTLEDAIGGLKVYTQGKKEFLDTSYEVVIRTGISDPLATNNRLLLNFNNDLDNITDATINRFIFNKSSTDIELSTDIVKYGAKSLKLTSGQYIQNNNLGTDYNIELNKRNYGYYGNDDIITSPTRTDFTLETWVKFTGLDDKLIIFSKDINNVTPQSISTYHYYNISVGTGGIRYYAAQNYYFNGYLDLYFSGSIQDNEWHHIALVNTSNTLIAFLDGVSGTSYAYWQNGPNYGDAQMFGSNPNQSGPWSGSFSNKLYYWSNTSIDTIKSFTDYWIYNTTSRIPTRIAGNGFIDDYRITFAPRYTGNFFPPNSLNIVQDDYLRLGDIQNLVKTRYGKIVQYYEYNNPINDQPWTTGLINHPSGLILGVKKV
jgi:hypothetical protein